MVPSKTVQPPGAWGEELFAGRNIRTNQPPPGLNIARIEAVKSGEAHAMFFVLVILGLPVYSLLWWLWAHVALRRAGVGKAWRRALAAFVLLQVGVYGVLIASRFGALSNDVPLSLIASTYLWHLIALPLGILLAVIAGVLALVAWVVRVGSARAKPANIAPLGERARNDSPHDSAHGGDSRGAFITASTTARGDDAHGGAASPLEAPALSRRGALVALAAGLPPAISIVSTGVAMSQVRSFRVRELDIPVPGLPRSLEGMTIAHVSDIHAGRFTGGAVLKRISEATSSLRADVALVTGDIIDHSLDDLPAALDCLRAMDSRAGTFLCEGNHDLFQGAREFEDRVKAAGLPLLLDESATVRVRGESIRLLGLRWATQVRARKFVMQGELPFSREPDAFSILLAHHPHAFDAAAKGGVGLTLAGHTHGGQLMLSESVGAGPMMYKYWSGLYTRPDASLVVSNGVGNWFPLRTFAPAEILKLTLRAV